MLKSKGLDKIPTPYLRLIMSTKRVILYYDPTVQLNMEKIKCANCC